MAFSVEKFLTEMNKRVLPLFEELKTDWQTDIERFNDYADNLIQDIDNLYVSCPKTPKKKRSIKRPVITSDEEAQSTTARSISPVFSETNSNTSSISAKSKRNASKLAQQKINDITHMKLNSKLRRPGVSDKENMDSTVVIKLEKISLLSNPEGPGPKSVLTDTTSNLEMPPPPPKPTKQRKKKIKKEKPESSSEDEPLVRITRSKRPIKKEPVPPEIIRQSNRSMRQTTDSDIIIQEPPILAFDISDSDDDQPLLNRLAVPATTQEKATKTKDKVAVDVVPEITNSLKEISLYEDACSDVNNTKPNETITLPTKQLDATLSINNKALDNVDFNVTHIINKNKNSNQLDQTHIINKQQSDTHQSLEAQLKENGVKNCTVLLENMHQNVPKITAANPVVAPELTDDESIEVPPPTKKIRPKPMFSPYANSPVKKRVAAFEKLGTEPPPVDIPTRVTRTKTRKDAAAESKESRLPVQNKFTPIFNNHLPSFIPQSDSRVYRLQHPHTVQRSNNQQTNNYVPIKSATAAKPTKLELQERREAEQKVRFEKEDEVRRKKDALLQEKAEERRKRREEKQERAQKAREAKEKEKEDKLRQLIQEKEDRLEKEEKLRKEWAAKNAAKAEEKRKLEEQVRKAKIRENEARKKLEEERRARLAIKPPPLPTEDCDSSDCESEAPEPRKKVLGPDWGRRENLFPVLLAHRYIPNAVIDTFFQVHAQTPDLRQIFETIDERQLRRNSSAIWNTPPRYSKLPKF